MVTTHDKDVRDRVHAFMNVGRAPGGARWEYPRLGWNYRPSEYLAALLIARLEKFRSTDEIFGTLMHRISQKHLSKSKGLPLLN